MTWSLKTRPLFLAQLHSYLLGLKSFKTVKMGIQKNCNLHAIISTTLIINLH
jgi:hypothetical protein